MCGLRGDKNGKHKAAKWGERGMTKGEYCELKGLHTYSPNFNKNEELDEDFKKTVDTLCDELETIHSEDENCEV